MPELCNSSVYNKILRQLDKTKGLPRLLAKSGICREDCWPIMRIVHRFCQVIRHIYFAINIAVLMPGFTVQRTKVTCSTQVTICQLCHLFSSFVLALIIPIDKLLGNNMTVTTGLHGNISTLATG